MAIEEFREPIYPMSDAIAARVVFDMLVRELNKKAEFARAGKCFGGTYTCPYCFLDVPHTAGSHDVDRDYLERVIHSGAQLLTPPALAWARGRLEKLYHAPRFDGSAEGKTDSGSVK